MKKHHVKTTFPVPKISIVLQEVEEFTHAMALDLNMGYYTIRLDPDAQNIGTSILKMREMVSIPYHTLISYLLIICNGEMARAMDGNIWPICLNDQEPT